MDTYCSCCGRRRGGSSSSSSSSSSAGSAVAADAAGTTSTDSRPATLPDIMLDKDGCLWIKAIFCPGCGLAMNKHVASTGTSPSSSGNKATIPIPPSLAPPLSLPPFLSNTTPIPTPTATPTAGPICGPASAPKKKRKPRQPQPPNKTPTSIRVLVTEPLCIVKESQTALARMVTKNVVATAATAVTNTIPLDAACWWDCCAL